MQFFTYLVLAFAATAAVIDPQVHVKARAIGDMGDVNVAEPRALELAQEIRHLKMKRDSNITARAIEPRDSNVTARSVEVRHSNNTAKAKARDVKWSRMAKLF
ncbi:uncharacterized protein BCR38DRAFT_481937 [Pseudomassariella vexata]|uniref:Uncharacterized protein n=1 Tax=Pseudomassariella vexata TaxID=1141098 RepID=A0A1Y2EA36_9PEZI|nr:uncharacterized protein BCR38DRAFT_481937 [Pseudomassariella vexata]ORY68450.1 hypothetical protein BCR38DRAFT_481937 [Pseudomassariella vexata]